MEPPRDPGPPAGVGAPRHDEQAAANVAELIVKSLEEEGVQIIFGVPGEENEDLLFALERSSITFLPTRHEQGAAFMANVWGRLSGRAGVCLSTLGPGATNLLTGVADANLDKAPLVAITGQGARDRLHHESHQAIDTVALMRPVTKWSDSIRTRRSAAEMVRKAFTLAEGSKPGATHLVLPEDVASADISDLSPCEGAPLTRRVTPSPRADAALIERVARQLGAAKRPLLVVGNGLVRGGAQAQLADVLAGRPLPVVTTLMGKGGVDERSPQSLGVIGLGFHDHSSAAVRDADLVLTIGYDSAECPPRAFNPDGGTPIISVDARPAEIYARYAPELEVLGDIAANLEALAESLDRIDLVAKPDWFLPIKKRIRRDHALDAPREDEPLTAPSVLAALRGVMPDDAIILSDVGSHKLWLARNFPVHAGGACVISNGLASMGISLPGAIAASLLHPERPVVAVMGDGGFMMNAQELETAVRAGASFVCVVLRDDDFGLIRWKQRRSRGRAVYTKIQNPDLVALGRSFGIASTRIETAAQLREQVREALTKRRLCLLDVPIHVAANDRLLERLERQYGGASSDQGAGCEATEEGA